MAPSTATCVMFIALLEMTHLRPSERRASAILKVVLTLAIAPWAVIVLFYSVGESSLGRSIEHVAFHVHGALNGLEFGHMSPIAALAILLLCVSSTLPTVLGRRAIGLACCWMNCCVVAVAAAGLLANIYGAPLARTEPVIPMAFPTAIALLLLASATLMTRHRDAWPVKCLIGDSARARLLRVLIPISILLPVISGWPDAFRHAWWEQDPVLWAVITTTIFAGATALAITLVANRIGNDLDATHQRLQDAQASLLVSESRLEAAINASNLGIWDWDVNSGRVVWAGHMAALLGVAPDEFDGQYSTFQRRIHPDDCNVIERDIAHARQTHSRLDHRFRVVLPDGRVRWIHGTGALVRDSAGQIARMTGTIADVTELKAQEEQLQSHAAFLQTLIDAIPLPVMYKDVNGVHELVNKALADSLHVTPAEIRGRTLSELVGPQNSRIHDEVDRDVLSTGTTRAYETTFTNPDGSIRQVVVNKACTFGPDGKPNGIIGVVFDVTERNRAEEEIKKREALYRGIFDGGNDAILLSHNGIIVDCNAKAEELYGCSREKLLGHSPGDFSPAFQPDGTSSATAAAERLAAAVAGERPRFEWQHSRADGSLFDAEVSLSRLVAGDKVLVQGLAHDITKRKRIQEALRASEERMRALFDAAPVAIFSLAPDSTVTSWNAAATRIFGYTADEATGNPLLTVPDDSVSDFHQRVRAVLAGEEVSAVELRRKRKDGTLVDISLSAAPLTDANGNAVGIMAIAIDTSKRKRTEEQLLRVSKAVEQSPALIVITNVNGKIEYVNPKFVQVTGYSADEVIGKNPRFLKGGTTSREFYERMWATLRAGNEWRGEFRNRKKNGDTYWEAASISPIRDAIGTITHYVAVKEDITDRKAADDALRHSEAMMARAQCVANFGSWEWDIATGRLIWSEQTYRIFDVDPQTFTPDYESFLGRIHADDRERVRQCVDDAAKGEPYEIEYRIAMRDDSIRVVFALGQQDVDELGQPVRLIGTVMDVTARKLAEEAQARRLEIERERNSLRDSVDALEQVIGVVGHELRTPLAGLRAISEILLEPNAVGSEATTQFLGNINSEVIRLSDMVNNMLEVTRINSGMARWQWTEVDVLSACSSAVETIRPLVDAERVSLACEVDPPSLLMRGDADAIRRLVLNLVGNSQKHTSHGRIDVQVRPVSDEHGAWIRIDIIDTGGGIPQELACKLGEPFALNSGVTGGNHVKGSGLGLAICRGIVAAHGGSIKVKSNPEQGTTVTVMLRADLSDAASLKGVEISQEIRT